MYKTLIRIISAEEVSSRWQKSFWSLNKLIVSEEVHLFVRRETREEAGKIQYIVESVWAIPEDEERLPAGDEEPHYLPDKYCFDLDEVEEYENEHPYLRLPIKNTEPGATNEELAFEPIDVSKVGIPPALQASPDELEVPPQPKLKIVDVSRQLSTGKTLEAAFEALSAENFDQAVIAKILADEMEFTKTEVGKLFYPDDGQEKEDKTYRNKIDKLLSRFNRLYILNFTE